jgi:hypothetical protein
MGMMKWTSVALAVCFISVVSAVPEGEIVALDGVLSTTGAASSPDPIAFVTGFPEEVPMRMLTFFVRVDVADGIYMFTAVDCVDDDSRGHQQRCE